MPRMSDVPPHERPRERLLRLGAEALSDAELVAVLLGSGRPGSSAYDMAAALLADSGGLAPLRRVGPAELLARPGIGQAAAARVLAALALARRDGADVRPVISCSADLAHVVSPFLADQRDERVVAVALDRRNRVLHVAEVSRGGGTTAGVPIREVLAVVLSHGGTSLALAHNHPGGSLTPSASDMDATAALSRAARTVGLTLADHLIVAGERWASIPV